MITLARVSKMRDNALLGDYMSRWTKKRAIRKILATWRNDSAMKVTLSGSGPSLPTHWHRKVAARIVAVLASLAPCKANSFLASCSNSDSVELPGTLAPLLPAAIVHNLFHNCLPPAG
jgi:hypothetical protein